MTRSVATRQHAVNSPVRPKPQRTAAGDAWSALVVSIFQLNGRLTAIGDRLAAPARQSSARWQILAAIEDAPRSVADAARVLGLTRQSVQRVADLLERDGLASYGDNPAHQRAKLLQLTGAGRNALAQIAAAQRVWADRVGEQLGLARIEAANGVLSQALELLQADDAGAATRGRPRRSSAGARGRS